MSPGTYHVPVLADASIAGIGAPQLPSGIYVDATFGGGGHSRLILDALDANGRLFGFDQDANAHANATANGGTGRPRKLRAPPEEPAHLIKSGPFRRLLDIGESYEEREMEKS